MKFKYKEKGYISQYFGQNANPSYKKAGKLGHTGIDSHKGYGSKVRLDNTGHVYKIYRAGDLSSNWAGIYLITPYKDHYMEVCIGHLSEVFHLEGQVVPEGALIGKEGNKGLVYQGGIKITPEMQRAGDRRGSHRHENYRPVKKVREKKKDKHYLRDSKGNHYKDGAGYFYEILHNDNGYKGCVDPMFFKHEDTLMDKIRIYMNLLTWYNRKI